jgi:WD40 repeat protein
MKKTIRKRQVMFNSGVLFVWLMLTPLLAAAQDTKPEITVLQSNSTLDTFWDAGKAWLSPDESLVLALQGPVVTLYDVETGRRLRDFRDDGADIASAAFTRDGQSVIFGTENHAIVRADTTTGEVVWRRELSNPNVHSVAVSPDGRHILVGTYYYDRENSTRTDETTFVSLEDGEVLWSVDAGSSADGSSSIHFLPGGRRAVLRWDGSTIVLLDLVSRRPIAEYEGSWTTGNTLSLSPSGTLLISSGAGNDIIVRDIETGEQLEEYSAPDWVYAVDMSPDERFIAAGTRSGGIIVIDREIGEQVAQIQKGTSTVTFMEEGELLLTGSGSGTDIWNWRDGERVRSFDPQLVEPMDIALTRDGRRLFVSTTTGDIYVWDVQSLRMQRTLRGHQQVSARGKETDPEVRSLDMLPDGTVLASAANDGRVVFWDVDTLTPQSAIDTGDRSLVDARFSPDGSELVTATLSGPVRIWDVKTGDELSSIDARTHSAVFTPAAEGIVTVAGPRWTGGDPETRTVRRWTRGKDEPELVYGDAVGSFSHHSNRVQISDDGRLLLSAGGRSHIYDFVDGELLFELPDEEMTDAVFTPNGESVLAGFRSGQLREYDLLTNQLTQTEDAHARFIEGIVFGPDGERFYTISADATVQVRSYPELELLATAVAASRNEWVSWTPEGFFSGTDQAIRRLVYIVDGVETYDIDRFLDQYYRPDIIEAKIAGRDISDLVGERTAAETIVPLPEVQLEVERRNGSFEALSADAGGAGATPVSQSDYRIQDGSVRIRVTARDTGGGAEDLRFFHNGARVRGDARGLARSGSPSDSGTGSASGGSPAALQQTFTVELLDGENRFRAIAFSETRVESEPAEIILSYQAPQQVRPTLWLLAVGANEYQNPRYNLNYAVGDARGFAEAAARAGGSLFSQIETTLVLNEEATRPRVIQAFEEIADQARPQDVFMFFYAGHGIALQSEQTENTEFFFIMHDVVQMTSMEQVDELGISGPEFQELVTSIPARKQFHVIDACNAGAINTAFGIRGAGEEIALSRLSRATGSALLAASRDDQFAHEFDALGQGALTRAVLDGLGGAASGDDNEVTVGELKSYVENTVPRLTTEHTGQPQYPTGFTFGQDFPVAVQ